jgi:hypothetical protein
MDEIDIPDYIGQNHEHYKELCKPHVTQLRFLLGTTDLVFHGDIAIQFCDVVKNIIVDDVTKRLSCSAEDVIIILDGIDLYEFSGALDDF